MNRGTMLWQLGRYTDSRNAFAEAQVIAENPGHDPYRELLAWIQVLRAQLSLSRQDFAKAIAESQLAVKLAGSEFKAIAVQANYSLGLAESSTGQTARGLNHCKEAFAIASTLADPLPRSHALLAQAQAALNAGDAQTALSTSRQVHET